MMEGTVDVEELKDKTIERREEWRWAAKQKVGQAVQEIEKKWRKYTLQKKIS